MAVDKLKLEVVLSAIDKLSRPLSAARGKSRELAQQIEQTKERLKMLSRGTQTLEDVMSKAGVPTREMIHSQTVLREKSDRLNDSLQKQMRELGEVNRAMQRQSAIQQQSERIGQTRDRLARAGIGMGAAGAATLVGVGTTVSAYAEAEDAATGLRVAMMRANGTVPETFTQINKLAMRLGDKLPGTTADFQNMMTMLIRQGMSAESILGGLGEATAYLAVQMKMPTDQAAEFAAKMQDATKTSERDMMGLMDVIQKTFYLGVDNNNMLEGMKGASMAMQILHKEGLEGAKVMAPFLTMLDQAGMRGESAGNALRKIFQMSMDRGKVAKGAKEAGFALDFTNGKGEFGSIEQLFAQLKKLDSLSTEKRLNVQKTIFGDDKDTLEALNTIVKNGIGGYNATIEKMDAQADLQHRVNQQLGTLKNEWEAASGTFTNLLATAGAALAPDLKALVQWIGDATASVREFAAAHPTLMTWIMRLAAGIGVLLVVLGALLLGAAAVLAPFAMLGSVVAGFGVAMAVITSPITIIIAALALLATAAYMVWDNWDGIKGGLIALWDTVADAFVGAWTRVKTFFKDIWNEITSAFSEGIAGIAKLLINWSPLGAVYDKVRMVASLFGKKLPEKLTDNFTSTSSAPTISTAKTGFTARPAPAPVVQSGPSTFQIYAAPGMNPADVANLVDQKIQQRDAALLTRSRSRLADNN